MSHRLALSLAVLLPLPLLAQQAQPPQPPQARPPVFRAGAHYVRVDAYPTGKDGRIVEGLGKDDFEVYEDGKLQVVEQAEYVTFDSWTPEGERKDPRTQQDAYDLAADPTYRVFVIVIDPSAYDMEGRHYLRTPLHEFIERNLGPRDLFGLLTTENEWTDLVLGQTTAAASAAIDSKRWLDPDYMDERWLPYYECGIGDLIGRKKLDDTYALLEGLVKLLGLVRQERKGILFVSNGLQQPGMSTGSPRGRGLPQMPRIGIENGRIGELSHGDRIGGRASNSFCAAERMRLEGIDFGVRFRDLLAAARQGNVAFYPISPLGLPTLPFTERGGADMGAYRRQVARADSLITLANETDGVAIVNTNDLSGGMRRIAADIHAYYVLGYYTSNTRWDGGVRSIKVRLKPGRKTIRARKQYRAPTEAEIAAFSAPAATRLPTPEDIAFAALARTRRDLPFRSYAARNGRELSVVLEAPPTASAWVAGTEITVLAESGDGDVVASTRTVLKATGRTAVVTLPMATDRGVAQADVRIRSDGMVFTDRIPLAAATTLLGDPIMFRNGTATAVLSCTRDDAVRIEWGVSGALDDRSARLLDRTGRPLSVALELRQNDAAAARRLVLDLSLAPLGRGEYLVELNARAGTVSERKLLPLRVN